MRSWLARIGSPQAIGIHVAGSEIHACRVASTPFGFVTLARQSEPMDVKRPQEAIIRLVAGLSKRRLGQLPVAVGLPVKQLFFTTRPMQAGSGEASPRVLLREAMFSATLPLDEMVVNVLNSQPGSRKLASIVACDKTFVQRLLKPFRSGALLPRVEPSPCALVRLALKHDRTHRRANVACRVFLNDTHALAVLAAQSQPLLWRQSHLPRGDEASAILSLVRSLTTISEQSGLDTPPDVVVVHGRSDLSRLLDMDWLRQQVGVPLHWLDDSALDHEQMATGLAEGCLGNGEASFDLAKCFQPQRSLWQSFPGREAFVHMACILALAVFLSYRLLVVNDACTVAKVRNGQHAIASRTIQELQAEKKDLKQRVAAVQKFLNSRVVWTNHERALAANLPEGVFLTSLNGVSEFSAKSASKSKIKKQLVLKCAVSLQQSGLIPYAVDRLLNRLREHPTLTRDFPVIELAELKQFKRTHSDETLAMFTLVCLPKGAKKAK